MNMQKQSLLTRVLSSMTGQLTATVLGLVVLMPLHAHANSGALMTGRALANLCASSKNDDRFVCQTYIAGVVDYHNLIRGLGTVPSVDFCTPRGLSMDQMRQVVYAYIARHSEHHDFTAAPAVVMALYNRFPCAKKKR